MVVSVSEVDNGDADRGVDDVGEGVLSGE